MRNHQVHGLSLPRSQRPTTAASTPSARQTATQHGALRSLSQVMSETEGLPELRRHGGSLGGLPRFSTQRATLDLNVPSTSSSSYHVTPWSIPDSKSMNGVILVIHNRTPHYTRPFSRCLTPPTTDATKARMQGENGQYFQRSNQATADNQYTVERSDKAA